MARHIYIHFHDAGTAHDPSNGQFTSGTGDAAHHEAAAEGHRQSMIHKTSSHPDFAKHDKAMARHQATASLLKHAQAAHEKGESEWAGRYHSLAKQGGREAANLESKIGTPAGNNAHKLMNPGKTRDAGTAHDPSEKRDKSEPSFAEVVAARASK
jgi:hypothetical protein